MTEEQEGLKYLELIGNDYIFSIRHSLVSINIITSSSTITFMTPLGISKLTVINGLDSSVGDDELVVKGRAEDLEKLVWILENYGV